MRRRVSDSLGGRRVRGCCKLLPGGPVELSAPATGPAPAPCGRELHSGTRGRRAGGGRRWRRRDRVGCTARGRGGSVGARRSSLGSLGRAQRRRRSVRGSGSAGAWRAGGGGVAAAALTPGCPEWGYRQRGDRPDGDRVRDRNQDANGRHGPPDPRPGHSRVAAPTSAALVPSRGAPGAVRGACPRVGGGRGRGSCGVARPPGFGAQSRRRNLASARVPGLVALPG